MNDSREHILFTSLKLFLQNSFKDVTMKQIVEQSGLSKGAFYHYFTSKEQVFEEALKYFYPDMVINDLIGLPEGSLKLFYKEVLRKLEENKKRSAKLLSGNEDQPFNANYYYLIFDAVKILPHFKEKLFQQQKEEIKIWVSRVYQARLSGEIKSPLSDLQIAKMFIYMGDGVGISMIMEENTNKIKSELKSLWDGLYDSIKA
ncbi:MAG TPA: TetR/AcrR family transcriptional regulator [Chitinophaga sp.]|uniref:TetR/AcrR family transcriptional regulator n=1 Tax=Chitinophaga sp. TaxID=1869181 RepID=UPI002CF0E2EA|nr:TetR/AcrR family transcriptional regulator [Chitinophaga sp.]HVI45855.1 TetR/AcrR family transcriptional regulator [Chitinophaga sp.]